jgi:hypothetical protein
MRPFCRKWRTVFAFGVKTTPNATCKTATLLPFAVSVFGLLMLLGLLELPFVLVRGQRFFVQLEDFGVSASQYE